jgi:hypothetical protein
MRLPETRDSDAAHARTLHDATLRDARCDTMACVTHRSTDRCDTTYVSWTACMHGWSIDRHGGHCSIMIPAASEARAE